MKSRAAKDKVRDEITKTISEHMSESLKEIAEKTADRVVDIWQEFRRAHAKVVEFAGREEGFKRFLDTIKPGDLSRLDEIVALVLASEGEAGVMRRLADGTLNRAVTGFPPAAIEIARETRSLEVAFKWSAVAGDSLPQIVDYGMYRRTNPETFTKAGLQRLLVLQDRLAIGRLAAVDPAAREVLLDLDRPALVKLARSIDEVQLASLSRYLSALEKGPAKRILSVVAETPGRMAELSSTRVREAIIASRDQAAAVSMMLQVNLLPDPGAVMAHVQLVLDGRVSPLLLWEKDGGVLGALALLALVLLLILRRLLFGTRPRIVVQHVSPRGSSSR
jgi:hypothetical protein